MKNILTEGQTQVYLGGGINPQYGVNTNMPHLNQPPKQIVDIIAALYTGSKKSDAQIIAILVGMGTPQQLAISGLMAYKQLFCSGSMQQENAQSNKFTLVSLYENVVKCLNDLKNIDSDESRVSYSTKNAIRIVESYLPNFPMRFKQGTVNVISEDVENSVNPTLKFKIAKNLHKQLSVINWIKPITNLREFIENVYFQNSFLFKVNESIESIGTPKGRIQENMVASLSSLLRETDEIAKAKFQLILEENPLSTECKEIDKSLKEIQIQVDNMIIENEQPSYNKNENKKNKNTMKFTLVSLYENVTKCIEELKQIASDKSRISYSSEKALGILEMFVNSIQTQSKRFELDDIRDIIENIESTSNPTLKFRIAKNLHSQLSAMFWVQPIQNLREFIESVYASNEFLFRVDEAIQKIENQRGALPISLVESLTLLLDENNDNAKSKFKNIAKKNLWSTECKAIANELLVAESKLIDTSQGKIIKTLSPVLESSDGLSFYLHGKVYTIKGSEITEGTVNDARFYNVIEGLKLFKHDGDSLVTFGESGKTLEYSLKEGTLTLGNVDMTNASIVDLSEALLATNFSGYKNHYKNDVICSFFESIELLHEMDNFTTIQSQEWLNLFLTVIAVDETIFVNKVNPAMQLNEMKKVQSATEAVESVKEFINFDIAPILSERLVSENNSKAIQAVKINAITEKLTFLEEQKQTISDAITKLGSTNELNAAMNLLEGEIRKTEIELSGSYLSEKKVDVNGLVKAWFNNPDEEEQNMRNYIKKNKNAESDILAILTKLTGSMTHQEAGLYFGKLEDMLGKFTI